MVLLKSLKFWTLLISLAAFILKAYYPEIPVTESTLLNIVLLLLGFFHIQPEVMNLLKK